MKHLKYIKNSSLRELFNSYYLELSKLEKSNLSSSGDYIKHLMAYDKILTYLKCMSDFDLISSKSYCKISLILHKSMQGKIISFRGL